MRRPELRHLDRREPAVADPPHPDLAVAPGLGRQPLDRVVPVERLGLACTRRARPRRTSRSRGCRPGRRRSRGAPARCRAPRRRCAASCPCRTGSSRGSPGTRSGSPAAGRGQPQVRRQLEPVARRDPDVPPVSTSWRGLAGRAAVRLVGGASSAESTGRRGPVGRDAARPCDDAGDGRRPRAADRERPWPRRSRRVAYENPWITVWHDEVDRPDGAPGIYGVVHFANLAVGVVAIDDHDRVLLVGQYRYTLDAYSWEIPEGGVPPGETRARRRPARAARGDRRRRRRLARDRPRRTSRTRSPTSSAVLFLRDRPVAGRRRRPTAPRTSRSAGCRSTRSSR